MQSYEIAIGYDSESRPNTLTTNNLESGSVSRTVLAYNTDGLITSILEEEIEPSPFSTEFRFTYTSGIITTIDFIVDGSATNTFDVDYDPATNTYSFNNGGEQVFDFDDANNLVSYTASSLPFLSITHDSESAGIANGLSGQIALGILLGDSSTVLAFGLYYFSTIQVEEVTLFDTTGQINSTYEDGLLISTEARNGDDVTNRTEITYETVDL